MGLRRREFVGGAAAWPLAARAQQGDRVRRIGVLMPYDENDPAVKTYVCAFTQALASLGWTDPRNVRPSPRRPIGFFQTVPSARQRWLRPPAL
jgi:putative ABC transport system substrate-binding protein